MSDIREKCGEGFIFLDGAMGVMLQQAGFRSGCMEEWNVSRPDEVKKVYEGYKKAGSHIIQTNTFGGSRIKLSKYGFGDRTAEFNRESARLAKEVMGDGGLVAASVGPTGEFLYPLGSLSFDEMYEVYKEQLVALEEGGADLVNFETFMDLAELRIALLAAKENTKLPVSVSCTFEGERTLMGNTPEAIAVIAEGLGAYAVGANCSTGPEAMAPVIKRMSRAAGIEIAAKPNAGVPAVVNGATVFPCSSEDMARGAVLLAEAGATVVGGCCGNTPAHVAAIIGALRDRKPLLRKAAARMLASPISVLTPEEARGRLLPIRVTADPYDILDALSEAGSAVPLLDFADIAAESIPGRMADIQSAVKVPLCFVLNDDEKAEAILRSYCGLAGVTETAAGLDGILKKYGTVRLD